MELTKGTVTQVLGLFRIEFPSEFEKMSATLLEQKVALWYEQLKCFPKEIVIKAAELVLRESEYMPKIATVYKKCELLAHGPRKTEIELWEELAAALDYTHELRESMKRAWAYDTEKQYVMCRETYITETRRIYDGLDSEIKLYVLSAESLQNMSAADSTERGRMRDEFLRLMPGMRKSERERAEAERCMPAPSVRDKGDFLRKIVAEREII